jgi:hypothetical protein
MPEWWRDDDDGREKRDGDGGGWCSLTLALLLAFVATVLWFLAGS